MRIAKRNSSSQNATISAGGKTINVSSDGSGGGDPEPIDEGQTFQGRLQGGGTRDEVFGSHDYGSGYPGGGILRGTTGRDLPFYFWPIAWATPFVVNAGDAYLHPSEYGLPQNVNRPGGSLAVLTYVSNTRPSSTFRVLTDYTSANSLSTTINATCSSFLILSPSMPSPYLEYAVTPLPEQTLQYYRASSAALTLDGYNNTAALVPQDSSDSYSILLPAGTDNALLHCINNTIGSSLLLYDPGPGGGSDQNVYLYIIIFASLVSIPLWAFCIFKCAQMYCGRRGVDRDNPAMLPPSIINDSVPAPPPAMIVFPAKGGLLSSGKAGDLYDDDDSSSLVKNAQPFAGVYVHHVDEPRKNRTSWWKVPLGNHKSEDIELDVKK